MELHEIKKYLAIQELSKLDLFLLECMEKLLAPPWAWTKNRMYGRVVEGKNNRKKIENAVHEEADSFCLWGAAMKCNNFNRGIRNGIITHRIFSFNDDKRTNKRDVLDAIREAMESKKKGT